MLTPPTCLTGMTWVAADAPSLTDATLPAYTNNLESVNARLLFFWHDNSYTSMTTYTSLYPRTMVIANG
jgi:hypothetical protein